MIAVAGTTAGYHFLYAKTVETAVTYEEDVDDIETFVSGITAVTISYSTKSTVDGGELEEETSYTIAGVKDNYESISNLSMSVGTFITDSEDENKEKVCVLGASVATEIFGSAIEAYGSVIHIDSRAYVVNGVLSQIGHGALNRYGGRYEA